MEKTSDEKKKGTGRVTHRMIADKSGVSQATVSRALRNDPRISEKVRKRVQRVAAQLGHRPDPTFNRYMAEMRAMQETRKQELLAFVGNPELKETSYALEIRRGALKRADELGFWVDELWIGESRQDFRTANRIIKARNMKGVLLLPFQNPRVRPELSWSSFAAVSTTKIHPDLRLHGVHGDVRRRFEELADHVVQAGCRRPALVSWQGPFGRGARPRDAAYFWMWRILLQGDPIPPFRMEEHEEFGPSFLAWLEQHDPDCLWVCGQTMRDVIWSQLNRKWKQRLRVASYANVERNEHIAGIRVEYELVGRGAIDLLTAMVMRGEVGIPEEPKRVSFLGKFVGEF